MDIKLIILVLVGLTVTVTFYNIIALSVQVKKEYARRKRVNQLIYKDKEDMSLEEALDKITNFVETYITKNKESQHDKRLEIQLKMVELDKYFGAKEWKAFNVFMALLGLVLMIPLAAINTMYGVFVGVLLIVMPKIYFLSQLSSVRYSLISRFPDIISLINGYLRAGYTLDRAVASTIPFAGKRWGKLLTKMVADMEMMGVVYSLNNLKNSTDLDDVSEFCSLVKVAYEQGDIGTSFEDQAERMKFLQRDNVKKKIGRRKSMVILAQGPTILSVFIIAGAQAVEEILKVTSMI